MYKIKGRRAVWLFGIVLLIIITVVGYLGYLRSAYVTYQIDDVNKCVWRDGEVALTTAVGGPEHFEKIKKSDEKAFLKEAEESARCVYKE